MKRTTYVWYAASVYHRSDRVGGRGCGSVGGGASVEEGLGVVIRSDRISRHPRNPLSVS